VSEKYLIKGRTD